MKGSPMALLNQGTKSERGREGKEAKAVSHLLQPQIPGLQGDLQPEPPNPTTHWAPQPLFPGFGMLNPPPDTTP